MYPYTRTYYEMTASEKKKKSQVAFSEQEEIQFYDKLT